MSEITATQATVPTVYGVKTGKWETVATLAARDYGTQATMAAHLFAIRATLTDVSGPITDAVLDAARAAGVPLTRSRVGRLLNTAEILADAGVVKADIDAARAVVVGLNAGAAVGACRKRVAAGEALAEVMADEAERAAARKATQATARTEDATEPAEGAEATQAEASQAEPMTADHVTAWLALNTVTQAEYDGIVAALKACGERSGVRKVAARKVKATA
jgi:hypothetical protein